MFGEPEDVENECNAHLYIGDNYGDNHTTMRCALAPGHDGLHQEQYESHGSGIVTITWGTDARRRCDHGCGQWKHAHDESIKCPKDADDHEFSDCAFCHPDREGKECEECGKTYYYEGGHKRHCPGQAFACTDCGENGHGISRVPEESRRRLRRICGGLVTHEHSPRRSGCPWCGDVCPYFGLETCPMRPRQILREETETPWRPGQKEPVR